MKDNEVNGSETGHIHFVKQLDLGITKATGSDKDGFKCGSVDNFDGVLLRTSSASDNYCFVSTCKY